MSSNYTEAEYVLKNPSGYFVDDKEYYQVFKHEPFAVTQKSLIMKAYHNGQFDENEIKVANFVYTMGVVTEKQIFEYCKINDIELTEDALDVMRMIKILNSFVLCNKRKYISEVAQNAEVFYCLDLGGKYVLDQLSNNHVKVSWEPGDNIMCAQNVFKAASFTQFYLDMYKSNANISRYSTKKFHNMRGDILDNFHSIMIDASNGDRLCIFVDAFRTSNEEEEIERKLKLYSDFIKKGYWKKLEIKYEPTIMFVADNDEQVTKLSHLTRKSGNLNISRCIFTTLERLSNGLEANGTFLRYNKDDESLYLINSLNIFS